MEMLKHKQIKEAVEEAHHVLLLPDERIDGDSVGAALAMYRYLLSQGKQVTVFINESIPAKYDFLEHIEVCREDRDWTTDESIDLVISLDCSDEQYIKGLHRSLSRPTKLINIDHHDTNSNFGDIDQVVTDATSTTEIVYRFFIENKIYIDPAIATALLAGLYFDTTVLSNKATRDHSMYLAAELYLLGADIKTVVQKLQFNRTLAMLQVWGLALERLKKHPKLDVVVTWITETDLVEHGIDVESMDGFSNFLHGVIEADTIIVLREEKGGVKASMRTLKGNVGTIAKLLGGGGHDKAAGFSLPGFKIIEKNGLATLAKL